MTSKPVLVGRGMTKTYGGVTAVSDVDIDIGEGEVMGLIGPNGAGKTTLVNMLSGHVRPNAGEIELLGRRVNRMGAAARARRGLRRTFQTPRVFQTLTVEENLLLAELGSGQGGRPDVSLLDSGILGKVASKLPMGERRRVEVVRAALRGAAVLLLDEPSSGLTPREVAELKNTILTIARGGTGVLLVSHDMKLVMSVCDRLQVMAAGATIAVGTPAEIRANADVIAAYLGGRASEKPA